MIVLLALLFILSSVFQTLFYFSYFFFLFKTPIENYIINNESNVFPTLSIIIPAYNEEITIKKKILNVLEYDYPQNKYEIIVVDDGSTDNTAKQVESFNNPRIKLLKNKIREGKLFALNKAFKQAKGEILITTDADIITSNKILNQIIPYFSNKKIGAVCASQVLVTPNEKMVTKYEKSFQNIYTLLRQKESDIDSTIVFNGEFTAIRKALMDILPKNAGVDDVEIPLIIRKKGYRCLLVKNATFFDYAPSIFHINIKQKIRRSQGIIEALWRHKNILFNSKYNAFGRIIYPAEFYMNIISPYVFFLTCFIGICLLFFNLKIFFICIISFLFTLLFLYVFWLRVFKKEDDNMFNISIFAVVYLFVLSQIELLFGSLRFILGVNLHKWKKIEDTRH